MIYETKGTAHRMGAPGNANDNTEDTRKTLDNRRIADDNGIIKAPFPKLYLSLPHSLLQTGPMFRVLPVPRHERIDSFLLISPGLDTFGNGGSSLSRLLLLKGLRTAPLPFGL